MLRDIGIALFGIGLAAATTLVAARAARRRRLIKLALAFDAGIVKLIRGRYNCTDEAARVVGRHFEHWRMDAEALRVEVAPDGRAVLDDAALAALDRCAQVIGLVPANVGESPSGAPS